MLSNGWSTLEKRGEISNTEGRLERRWEALWEGRAEVAAWLCPLSLTAVEWAALAASWPQPRAEEQIKRCHQSPFSTEKTLYLVSHCSPQSVFTLMLIKCSNCADCVYWIPETSPTTARVSVSPRLWKLSGAAGVGWERTSGVSRMGSGMCKGQTLGVTKWLLHHRDHMKSFIVRTMAVLCCFPWRLLFSHFSLWRHLKKISKDHCDMKNPSHTWNFYQFHFYSYFRHPWFLLDLEFTTL